jgi:hypothetical protein
MTAPVMKPHATGKRSNLVGLFLVGGFEVTDEHTASPEAQERGDGGGTIPCGRGVVAECDQGVFPPRRIDALLGRSIRRATLPPSESGQTSRE